jgi:hypothetical protein
MPRHEENRMRRFAIAAALLLTCAPLGAAHAGRIFGDIKMAGKPVPEGVVVMIALAPAEGAKAGAPVDTTKTDKFGSYKLSVKPEGKCTLTVVYEKQPVSLDVFSYKDATRYDLILEKKEGKLTVRRK